MLKKIKDISFFEEVEKTIEPGINKVYESCEKLIININKNKELVNEKINKTEYLEHSIEKYGNFKILDTNVKAMIFASSFLFCLWFVGLWFTNNNYLDIKKEIDSGILSQVVENEKNTYLKFDKFSDKELKIEFGNSLLKKVVEEKKLGKKSEYQKLEKYITLKELRMKMLISLLSGIILIGSVSSLALFFKRKEYKEFWKNEEEKTVEVLNHLNEEIVKNKNEYKESFSKIEGKKESFNLNEKIMENLKKNEYKNLYSFFINQNIENLTFKKKIDDNNYVENLKVENFNMEMLKLKRDVESTETIKKIVQDMR